jgi:raffinose/stachyose/melibiose transport system permease protein/N-acetylglucosamine transport system permease protein
MADPKMVNRTLRERRRVTDPKVLKRTLRSVPYFLEIAFLVIWVGFSLLAFAWVVLASLKSNSGFFAGIWTLPQHLHFDNYVRALSDSGLGLDFINTIVVIGVSVIVLLAISSPAAYALAKVNFPGVNWIATLFMLGIGIPVQVFVIPLFFLLSGLGLANTLVGLMLAYVVTSLPFTIFLLRGFFYTLPSQLEEAATIDGCTAFGAFRRVMLPLARGGLITATIFNVVFLFNDVLLALTLIQDNEKFTLSLGLFGLYGSMHYTGDWVALFAGFTVIMIPSLLIYLFLSRNLIEGLTMGATKG